MEGLGIAIGTFGISFMFAVMAAGWPQIVVHHKCNCKLGR